jgi:hypothetical protein
MFVDGEDRAVDITSLESVRKGSKQVIDVGAHGHLRFDHGAGFGRSPTLGMDAAVRAQQTVQGGRTRGEHAAP